MKTTQHYIINHVFLLRCDILMRFSHLFLVLNSSVNIIIYGWKDNKFREILTKLFHLNCLLRQNNIVTMNTPSKEEKEMARSEHSVAVVESLL